MRIAYLALVELDIPNACLIHTREIAEQMAALGHRIDLFLPRPLQAITPWRGVTHRWVRFWGFDALRRLCFMVESCVRIVIQHRKEPFDILYMRELPDPLLVVYCCRLLGIPYFVELNGWALDELAISNAPSRMVARVCRRQRLLFRNAAGIISSTQGNATNVMRQYRVTERRVTVQELGVNGDMFTGVDKLEARNILHLDGTRRYVLFAGSFHPHHDLYTLIHAIAIARKELPDLHLILAGDGAERKKAEQWVVQAGIGENAYFTGARPYEEMPMWFSAVDILMIPLLKRRIHLQNGSFVTKLWEAMAAKSPVIITDMPSTASYNELEDKAWIVPPENPEAMARTIVSVLGASAQEAALRADRAFRYVVQERSWHEEARQTLSFIRQKLAE